MSAGEDIPALANVLVRRAAERHATVAQPLPQAVLRRLMEHTWPGNVRELANALERLVLLAEDGRVSADYLPPEIGGSHLVRKGNIPICRHRGLLGTRWRRTCCGRLWSSPTATVPARPACSA